jgi:hypothetical protein
MEQENGKGTGKGYGGLFSTFPDFGGAVSGNSLLSDDVHLSTRPTEEHFTSFRDYYLSPTLPPPKSSRRGTTAGRGHPSRPSARERGSESINIREKS